MKTNSLPFDNSQYVSQETKKTQIVLHHTVSNGSAKAVAGYWSSKTSRIGTSRIVDKNGVVHQLYNDNYWAGHVGSVTRELSKLNLAKRSFSKYSLGVELVNMGGLKMVDGKLKDTYGSDFNDAFIYYEKGFRGYEYFAKYPDAQISALRDLLLYWNKEFDIPISYDEKNWDISEKALSGASGLYYHVSYRLGKSDIHPQKEMVNMLKTL